MDKDFDNMTNDELVIFFNEKKEKVNKICQEMSQKIIEYENIKKTFFDILSEIEKRGIKINI